MIITTKKGGHFCHPFLFQWQFISTFVNSKLLYSHLDMKYIADRLKTSIFLVLCLTIVMVTLASCSDNNAEDPDLKRFTQKKIEIFIICLIIKRK